ncbi:hypothetical protein ACFFRR_006788 [Megaselia abdita]
MNLSFNNTVFVLLVYISLYPGVLNLKLTKVSIPAYKLRGESAILECIYELHGEDSHNYNNHDNVDDEDRIYSSNSNSRFNSIGRDASGGNPNSRNNDGYINYGGNKNSYRRIRSYTQQQQHRNYHDSRYQPYQHQQQQYQQHQLLQQQQQRQHQNPNQQQPPPLQLHSQTQPSSITSYDFQHDHHLQQQKQHQQHYSYENSNEKYDDDGGGPGERGGDEHHSSNGESLYAVKWYKDNEEFYRYVPKANPQKQSYRVDGVRVIEENSDNTRVWLRGLALNSTGLYRCEVSAEAPNFSSVQGEGRMDIVYLPRDGPHIRGQQFQYQIGEMLSLNCTSGKSHPASNLQWFINEEPLTNSDTLLRYNDTVHKHGLITSTLGLQLTVDARHFRDGAMKVKCLASISPVLWKGGRESIVQRRPGVIDNREAMLLVCVYV